MKAKIMEIFKIPKIAEDVIDLILTEDEQNLLLTIGQKPFNADMIENRLLESAYKRGVINILDEEKELYIANSFYGRLDLFAMTEPECYLSLPREKQKCLDQWYFDAYVEGLGDSDTPSEDATVSLEDALTFIDNDPRQIWLNRCDCRTLAGNCENPTDTCLTYKNGVNTTAHRGWSKPLTKIEAKNVVMEANKAGLMQTINPNGLCNCCGDCCYLFRAQKVLGLNPVWPSSKLIADFEEDTCVTCLECTKRCHFEAFVEKESAVIYDPEKCRGCGLCQDTCPVNAIKMVERT